MTCYGATRRFTHEGTFKRVFVHAVVVVVVSSFGRTTRLKGFIDKGARLSPLKKQQLRQPHNSVDFSAQG